MCFSVLLIFFCLTASLFQASFHYTGLFSSMSWVILFHSFNLSSRTNLVLYYHFRYFIVPPFSPFSRLIAPHLCSRPGGETGNIPMETEQIPDVDDATAFL